MSDTASVIRFTASLFRPITTESSSDWTFLVLPKEASEQLPTRSMISIEGTINGKPFQGTLEPDGDGGHWLKVDPTLQETAGVKVGDLVTLEVMPAKEEPEPKVPLDLIEALANASQKAQTTWSAITPIARRDWIQWITSGKRAETRVLRIEKACDMLGTGKKRPCCFDRSGMYSKSMSCPVADMDS